MFTAHDENGNNVYIEDIEKAHSFYCPVCGGQLIVKKGKIRDWHFAHVSGECEDSWKYDMSEWHLAWQEKFPKECREITITHKGEKHRADVLVGKTVVEFQHSPMSCGEFQERNQFYTRAGYKIVWIFDFQDEYYDDKIYINPRKENDNSWIWNWAHQTFCGFLPQKHRDILLFFEIDDGELLHIKWFPDDSNKYFYTDEMSIKEINDIADALSPLRKMRKETGFCVHDLYDEIYTDTYYGRGLEEAEVFNCPKGKAIIENCYFCSHYGEYGCTGKFDNILEGWNNETDKVLKIAKDDYGIIRNVVIFKNGESKSISYLPSKVGYTLFELVYNTESSCIIVENVRTRNQFKIGTRYFQWNRNIQIEGYFRKDGRFDFPEPIPANRKPIYYANKPEWIITWKSEQ